MNTISLSGHLTEDPNLVHYNERPICEMRLAVDNGRHQTTFIDVRAFDEQAYVCAEYLSKGSKIGATGKLVYREWRAEDGTHRHRYSVIGHVEFLDRPPRQEGSRTLFVEPEDSGSESAQPELVAA